MSISDRARQLADEARQYASRNKDQIAKGVEMAERAADAKTGGRYHDQILKAGQKADDFIANLPTQPATPHPRTAPPADTSSPDIPGDAPA